MVPDTTYLGVTLREDLLWESHIIGITAKAKRTLGFLRRNIRYCPKQLQQLACYSLVRSRLEYASIVWGPCLVKDITKLDDVQRQAARFVVNDHRRTIRVATMLDTLGWDSLQTRRQTGRLQYMNTSLETGWQWCLMIIWNKVQLEPDQSTARNYIKKTIILKIILKRLLY